MGMHAGAMAVLVFMLSIFPMVEVFAQPATAPSVPSEHDLAAQAEAKRRDTIKYGIDSEIGDLVKDLTAEKDGRFNEDLLILLQNSRNPRFRVMILDFFATLEWNGAEKIALGFMDDRDNQDADIIGAALSYLASMRSKEALRFSEIVIKEDNKKLFPALVRLMGRAGGPAEEVILLGWFDGDSTTPALKEEAIKALGEIGSAKSAERLGKLVQDNLAGKAARMYACDALAKIKAPNAPSGLLKEPLAINLSKVPAMTALKVTGPFRGILGERVAISAPSDVKVMEPPL